MKRTVFFLMVTLVLATACNQGSKSNTEQKPLSPEAQERVDRQMESMKESLDLSVEQEAQIRVILAENYHNMQEMRAAMQDGGGDREAMREKFMEAREVQNEKMKKILDEQQWASYEEMMQDMRSRREQGRRGGAGRPE